MTWGTLARSAVCARDNTLNGGIIRTNFHAEIVVHCEVWILHRVCTWWVGGWSGDGGGMWGQNVYQKVTPIPTTISNSVWREESPP